MRFDELIRLQALKQKQLHHQGTDFDLVDMVLQQNAEEAGKLTRNICAHVSIQLFERVDNLCGVLEISKRQFVEQALIDAMEKAESIVSEVDPFHGEERL